MQGRDVFAQGHVPPAKLLSAYYSKAVEDRIQTSRKRSNKWQSPFEHCQLPPAFRKTAAVCSMCRALPAVAAWAAGVVDLHVAYYFAAHVEHWMVKAGDLL